MQPMQFRHVSLFSRIYRALRQPDAGAARHPPP
ncbi:hypothetical protein SeGA_2548, partial [Salmonella enterica subsp. enterica serovar Gaminara str. A4-567]